MYQTSKLYSFDDCLLMAMMGKIDLCALKINP